MKFLILTIFCNLLSSGHLQETYNERDEDYKLMQPNPRNGLPGQTFHTIQGNFYGQAQTSVPSKPCSRRSYSEREPINQQISPPYSSKVEALTSYVVPLKPQALRNGEYDRQITNNQASNSKVTNENIKTNKPIHSLTIINPVIDSNEENHHEIIPSINNEIKEGNSKPSEFIRSAPTSESLFTSSDVRSTPNNSDQTRSPSNLRFKPDNESGGAEIENNFISEPNNAIASEPNGLRSAQIDQPFTDKSEFLSGFAVEPQTLAPEIVAKLFSIRNKAAELPNKCSQDIEPDNLIGNPRRSMPSYNDEGNAKVLLNDKEFLRNNNDPYFESRIDNENAMTSVLNTEKNIPRSNQELQSLNKTKLLAPEKPVSRVKRPHFNEARRQMLEPTKGEGVVTMGQSALMLMQNERICYACSTANNPSCWAPDRQTTVKYCRKGNNACLTKTFGHGSTFTLIRDCGKSCDDSETGGIMPTYKSCSICHTELCNGAFSINRQGILLTVILTAVVKYYN